MINCEVFIKQSERAYKEVIMPRQEQKLMDGWEFAWGSPGRGELQEDMLPHDWAITAPVSENMKQGAARGSVTDGGIGWYRRTLTLSEIKPDMIYYLILKEFMRTARFG